MGRGLPFLSNGLGLGGGAALPAEVFELDLALESLEVVFGFVVVFDGFGRPPVQHSILFEGVFCTNGKVLVLVVGYYQG